MEVKFGENDEENEDGGASSGLLTDTEYSLYENIPRAGTVEDIDECILGNVDKSSTENASQQQNEGNCEILYENLPKTMNHNDQIEGIVQKSNDNIGTLDCFVTKPIPLVHGGGIEASLQKRGTYELLYIPDDIGTYEIPKELLREQPIDKSSTLEPPIDGHSIERLCKSAPTSPILTATRRAPLPPPSSHFVEPLYKDPAGLFDAVQLRRFTGATDTIHHPLQDSGSDFSIQDSGSDVTVGSGSEFANSFEDFIVSRRNQPKKQRAFSEIICSRGRNKYNAKDETGIFEMFKKSMFGGPTPVAAQARPLRPRSTFYISCNDEVEDEEAIYHSLESLPTAVATSCSTFYTDQEEHIYSTSDTLGPLDYPQISVENLGYRNPKVCSVEEHETAIAVKTARSGSHLSEDSFQSIPEISSDSENDTVGRSETPSHCPQESGAEPRTSQQGMEDQSNATDTSQYGPTKRRLTRVSLMRRNNDPDNLGEVRLRNKTENNRICQDRKQIVSMQFSSDILEIDDRNTQHDSDTEIR